MRGLAAIAILAAVGCSSAAEAPPALVDMAGQDGGADVAAPEPEAGPEPAEDGGRVDAWQADADAAPGADGWADAAAEPADDGWTVPDAPPEAAHYPGSLWELCAADCVGTKYALGAVSGDTVAVCLDEASPPRCSFSCVFPGQALAADVLIKFCHSLGGDCYDGDKAGESWCEKL